MDPVVSNNKNRQKPESAAVDSQGELPKSLQAIDEGHYGPLIKSVSCHPQDPRVAIKLQALSDNQASQADLILDRFWKQHQARLINGFGHEAGNTYLHDGESWERSYEESEKIIRTDPHFSKQSQVALEAEISSFIESLGIDLRGIKYYEMSLASAVLTVVAIDFYFGDADRDELTRWRKHLEERYNVYVRFTQEFNGNKYSEKTIADAEKEGRIVLAPTELENLLDPESSVNSSVIVSEVQKLLQTSPSEVDVYQDDTNRPVCSIDHPMTQHPEDVWWARKIKDGYFVQVFFPDARFKGKGYQLGRDVISLSVSCMLRHDGKPTGHHVTQSITNNKVWLTGDKVIPSINSASWLSTDVRNSLAAGLEIALLRRSQRLSESGRMLSTVTNPGHLIVSELMDLANQCFLEQFKNPDVPELPVVVTDSRELTKNFLSEIQSVLPEAQASDLENDFRFAAIFLNLLDHGQIELAEEIVKTMVGKAPYTLYFPHTDDGFTPTRMPVKAKAKDSAASINQIQIRALKTNTRGIPVEELEAAVLSLNQYRLIDKEQRSKQTLALLSDPSVVAMQRYKGKEFSAIVKSVEKNRVNIYVPKISVNGILSINSLALKPQASYASGDLVRVVYEGFNPFLKQNHNIFSSIEPDDSISIDAA